MSTLDQIKAFVLVLALVSGLLITIGSLKAKTVGEQGIFVAGWSLILVSSLLIVQNY